MYKQITRADHRTKRPVEPIVQQTNLIDPAVELFEPLIVQQTNQVVLPLALLVYQMMHLERQSNQ